MNKPKPLRARIVDIWQDPNKDRSDADRLLDAFRQIDKHLEMTDPSELKRLRQALNHELRTREDRRERATLAKELLAGLCGHPL